jgi:hypothetical protein
MSMGLVRMSAMLSGKMTLLDVVIELHEEPWIPSLPGVQTFKGRDLDSPQGG